MYLQFLDSENFNHFESLPFEIRLADGSSRTSLYELSVPEREDLGLIEYTDITPEFDTLLQQWDNSYTFDHENRTATKNIVDRDPDVIKQDKMKIMLREQLATQQAGFTCTNGIKLQTEDDDLINWTQLMAGITAFAPETVVIRDYNNINHTVTSTEATQMMKEVFSWGQWLFQDTWEKKDAILNGN